MSTKATNAVSVYHFNLGFFFKEVVAENPQQTALRYEETCYRYSDLALWIDRFEVLLLRRDCRRGDVIAIGHSKRPLSYALMHAALRLGIAYVNIDMASPVERTSKILEVSGISLLLYDDPDCDSEMKELASALICEAILLSEDDLPSASLLDVERQQLYMTEVDGSTIAYIMFTSGSTGIPKGVAVTHQNLLHFISWGQEYFGITNQDNFANLSPMYFDNSVFDFYVGMFSGSTLTPVNKELLTNPYDLVPYVERMECTIWFSVPSLLIFLMTMKAVSRTSMPELRTIVFGGEGYPKIELKKLYEAFVGRANLVNVYGPTECTCICSAHTISDEDFVDLSGLPTMGQLNPNFDYRILDAQEHDSESGELCLIGPNVAAGYFKDLERTAIVFHTLTDSNRFMKRMYRTGDLVRIADGMLYFIGRKDNQIKHMGYRIELEEIEHALVKLAQVDQAAVIYYRSDTAYGKLIGFVACSAPIDEKPLLMGLASLLPDYMIPSSLTVMTELPKNPNGKVDRQQLRDLYVP